MEYRGLGGISKCPAGHAVPSPAHTTLISPYGEQPAAARLAPDPNAETVLSKAPRTTREKILWSYRWTPSLITIGVTRDAAFRFTPGHYARLGITDSTTQTVFRPLSIASAPGDPWLEFFCTLIPGGAFSARLAALRVGDPVEVERASYGFLTVDSLAPGTDLWLLASGTGLAPFLSMLRDQAVWQAFDRLVVVHSVRCPVELAYADEIERLAEAPSAGSARARLRYVPTVTREPVASALAARIPALIASGRLSEAVGMILDPSQSRVMVCGNPGMTRDLRALLSERGFRTSRRAEPGQVAFEKYW